MAESSEVTERVVAGRYHLLEPIGRGGMGTVWRAHDEVLGREIAVKELIAPPELTGPEREIFTLRTFREARAAGRVSHAGVATVYDVFEENGHPWIVLQFVPSETLGAVVRDHGPLAPARVARIGLEVLSALRAAHRAGVLHRDVKPDNVLLDRDNGRAVLTDFGIATLDDDSPVTRTGTLVGTPAFIAPERAAGGQATRASDLWSLGVTLYVAVEGRSPFHRGNPLATLGAVMHDPPEPVRLAGPLTAVLAGLLQKDPARRLTAAEAERSLRLVAAGRPPTPTTPVMPMAAPAPVPARTGASAVAGGPAATAAAGAIPPRPGAGGRGIAVAGLIALILSVGLVAGGLAWVTARSQATGRPPVNSPTVRVTVSVTPAAKRPGPVSPRTPERTVRQDPAPRPSRSPAPDEDETGDQGEDRGDRRPADPSVEPTEPTATKDSGQPHRDDHGDRSAIPPGGGHGHSGDQGEHDGLGDAGDDQAVMGGIHPPGA